MPDERNALLEDGIHEIRPKVLFRKIEESFPNDNVMFSVGIPTSYIGGLTLLESSVLVALSKLTSPLEYFEFGTFFGATSVLLSANSPEKARITTLDLAPESIARDERSTEGEARYLVDDVENDNYLRRLFAENGALYIKRAEKSVKAKIHQIFHDSRTLDLEAHGLVGRFDFIFIDGGHDFETIRSDSENALRMAKPDAVIIWHDFRSKIHSDVTRFLDDFGRSQPIIHVQNSMLAFTLRGRFRTLL